MSQVKYLVYAVLLLLFLATIGIVVQKLSSTKPTAQNPTTVGYVEPSKAIAPIVNTEGKNLFAANCGMCHRLSGTDNFNFESVETRGPWIDRQNLITWIKNPAATIKKFQYAKDLVEQFNGQIMPSFSILTDAQVESILDYIKSTSTAVPVSNVAVN